MERALDRHKKSVGHRFVGRRKDLYLIIITALFTLSLLIHNYII